jgi:Uma2 family endonuclease
MSTALEEPRRHDVTVHEYLRMGEAGVFAPDARVELIEGEIIDMAPIGPPHASTVAILNRLFVRQAGDDAFVWVQSPMILGSQSMPQPDLAILRSRTDDYSRRHPLPGDILLAVEVSDSTLAFDLKRKAPLYARYRVTELWVVDVNAGQVVVHRGPTPRGYATSFTVSGEEQVSCVAFPQVRVSPCQLFRK